MCPIVKWFYESDRTVLRMPKHNRKDRGTKRIDEKKITGSNCLLLLKLFYGSDGYIK